MTKQDVSVVWTEAVPIQMDHVNSTRHMSLVKGNLGYALEGTVGYVPIRTPTIEVTCHLMKFLALHPGAK